MKQNRVTGSKEFLTTNTLKLLFCLKLLCSTNFLIQIQLQLYELFCLKIKKDIILVFIFTMKIVLRTKYTFVLNNNSTPGFTALLFCKLNIYL